jgi:hypothetical protein
VLLVHLKRLESSPRRPGSTKPAGQPENREEA